MREIDVTLTGCVGEAEVERAIAEIVAELGLQVSWRGSLGGHPGSVHWHLKRSRQPGTLEVTFAPLAARLWLSVHAGREGNWVDEILRALPSRISAALARAQAGTS